MCNENQIQKVEPDTAIQVIDPNSPAGLMTQLMSNEGTFDVDGFGKMLEFQERHEANQAKKVFASGFAAVQSKIVAVVKTKVNPQTHSKYADLDSVIEMSKPVYTEQGFSIIYYEGETDKPEHMRLCADVLHKSGHKETYHLDIPLDGVGIKGNANMTKIHGKASSLSYGRRYLICMIWNIPTADDDGNGNKAAQKPSDAIKPPTKDEMAVILEISELLTPPDGMFVNLTQLTTTIYSFKSEYPDKSPGLPAQWAAFLEEQDRKEIFWSRDDATEADNALADKAIGKIGEPRYYCHGCELDYNKLTNGKCPNKECPGGKMLDRHE